MVGMDASIIMNTKVWEASEHLKNFTDPLVECSNCHTRIRPGYIDHDEKGQFWFCPNCKTKNEFNPRRFNLMFKTFVGTTDESANLAYLRPEIAQAMFVNFKNVLD